MPPQTISHFELIEKVGEGGMGAVYKARDIRLNRMVALKFLSSAGVDSPEDHERFRQEGQALSALSHPHVATVYEVDELDGAPFMVLEYLAGGTLRSRIKTARGQLPVTAIVDWAIDLAEGLEHVHRHAVVHCDVTSSNVMFDAEGRIKLTDFGLARIRSTERVTGEKILGTMGYMSPEQLQGTAADARSDLFSFGVLLYEMLTGQLPFQAPTKKETIQRVLSDQPRPLLELRPDLPAGLEKIVNRLIEKQPEHRYARALEVVHDLRALRAGTPEDVATTTMKHEPQRSRRWLFWAAACLVMLIIGLNAAGLRRWIWRRSLPERKHIAVIPFRSIGGDASQQAFCDGLTETLTTALTKHGGFSVVPAVDARRLESATQARQGFGVNLVITGSVQRRGENVLVTINLIDAAKGRQMDAEPVTWPAAKLFEMEDAVLSKISDLLNVTDVAPPSPFVAGAEQLPSAYDAYLRGRGYFYRSDKAGNLDRAREEFETAVRLDTKFALAYVGLSDVQRRLYLLRNDRFNLESARVAAAKAVELNSSLAGGHVAMGGVLIELKQPDDALAELELALKLDPRDPAAYRELALLHRSQKRFHEAEQVYLRGIATRPGDWLGYNTLGLFYLAQQRNADAEPMFRKVIELTPDNHLGYRSLGTTLHRLGRKPQEAEESFKKATDLYPTGRTYSNWGALLMFHERYTEAVPIMLKAVELSAVEAPGDYIPYGNLGDAYQLSGDPAGKAKDAWHQALQIVERRMKGKEDDPELLATRGMYRSKIGETAMALQDAERAVLLGSGNPTVRYLAALAFAVAGFKTKALEEIAAALRQGFSAEEIRRAPEFSGFRADPAFEQILSKAAPR